uniref:RRP15-like protein n=1 Tax=Aceria tosichella TaxID=561515 RepID=A0A6G1SKK4_9ACAR
MDTAFGEGWADAVSKILSIGKHNQAITILSKAKKDAAIEEQTEDRLHKPGKTSCRLLPQAQPDALVENELRSIATRGVVHLFNAVKAVNSKSDKKRKKKKKKKRKKRVVSRKI